MACMFYIGCHMLNMPLVCDMLPAALSLSHSKLILWHDKSC